MGDDTTADESYHQYFGICKVNGGKESVIDKRMLKLQCCLHQGEINKQAGQNFRIWKGSKIRGPTRL